MNYKYILYVFIAIIVATGGYLLYTIFTRSDVPSIYDTDNFEEYTPEISSSNIQ